MCAQRMQRIIQAILLGFVMGMAGQGMYQVAFLIMLAMIIMLLVAGFTGFCPSLMILKEVLPDCDENKEK